MITAATPHLSLDADADSLEMSDRVEQAARQRLSSECPYEYYFREVHFEFGDGVLTLRGQVPTFYLKQILQTRLSDLMGVERIDNRVDVVSSVGLSSVHRE